MAALLATGLQVIMGCTEETNPIFGDEIDRGASAAVFSALSASQTVKRVFLSSGVLPHDTDVASPVTRPIDRRQHWHWITYTFFSRFVAHRISNLIITASGICMQDITCVDEFLQHPDPLVLLRDKDTELKVSVPTAAEFVTARRFHLSPPPADPTASTGSQRAHEFPRQQVQILSKNSEDDDESHGDYELVLLPGYGNAWVRRCDIEERVCSRPPHPTSMALAFHRMAHEEKDAIAALLRLVGHNITCLTFMNIEDTAPLDAWLLDVLKFCPRLLKLKLHRGLLKSLDTIAEAFELGFSRVEDVWIRGIQVVESAQAPAFLVKLADDAHPMTTHLRQFEIDYNDASGSPSTLTEACRSGRESLAARHSREQPDANSPAETAVVLALVFLTVVVGSEVKWQAMRAVAVDERVLSLVFEYAAQCHKRSIHVEFMDPISTWNTDSEGDDDNDGEEAAA